MKYTLGVLVALAALAQAPATKPYGYARSELFRVHSSLTTEQQGDAAIVMAASYACGKWDAGAYPSDVASVSTPLGTTITREDCKDVLLTIKSAKGSLVK